MSRSKEATCGDARPAAVEGRSGAAPGPGPSADGRVSPAGKAQQGLKERYRLGSLLGRGGFSSVFAATRLSDGAPPDGTSAPLEVVLLDKVSTGFPGVVQLLEWLELPNSVVLVMERPERSQDLLHFIRARGFLCEEVARELFRQVLEAVRHCTSCGVLHRDLKPENILVDLATEQTKLIDFGCGTFLQASAYTSFAGTPSYSPPEWTHFSWYHGEAATVWSLGIVLHQMVCGEHPFKRGWNISWGRLPLPQRLSQGGSSSLRHGGNSSAGRQQRAQEHATLAALRRWHMSCSPALLQKKELMGKFRHSPEHTQHGLGMARVGQSGQEPSATDWCFLLSLPRVPGCDKGVFIPALLGKALLRRPVV
uniref:non-specific serine/threonine protein kinase n=1 Tax=Corvus moneduloides TaxID=1196302 RepID=A0A8U7NCS5_CORMO